MATTLALAPGPPAGADGNEAPGAPQAFRSIAAGNDHTCALGYDGQVKCWGYNNTGQLGQGDTTGRGDNANEMGDNLPAVNLGTGRTATAIATGLGHTCALLDNARIKCWGDNNTGQLGQGNTTGRGDNPGEMGNNLLAVDLGSSRTATAVTTDRETACALLDNAQIKCWGSNSSGQLGQGDDTDLGDDAGEMGDALLAVDLGSSRTATAVTTGGSHSCAVLDNAQVKCWGGNSSGKLGLGDAADRGDGPGEMGNALPAVDLPPANDDFAAAETLSGAAGTRRGANPNTGKQPGEPDHDGFPAADSSVWYQWTPTVTGPTRITTFGSTFDTVLAVYTGTALATLTPIVANDDTSTPPSLQSQVRFTATAGVTYRIAVAGFNAASGPLTLTGRQIPPCDSQPVTVAVAFGDTPTPGADVIRGTAGADTINGGAGNDRICGDAGADTISGGTGPAIDRLFGEGGNDILRGFGGNDRLDGGSQNDRLSGDSGNDTLNGRAGADDLQGGTGADRLNGGTQRDNCNGGPQNDTHTGCEVRTSIP